MWIKVKCLQDITKGDVLSYNTSQQLWSKSSSLTTPLGVARKDAVLKPETDDIYIVEIQLQGQVEAKASRDIPDEGGELNVENGMVYVDNNANHDGIICPNFLDQPPRASGNLVTVIIR
mgnify:FL=1